MTRGDVKGFAMGGTSFKTFSYQFWLPFVWGAGGDVFNADKSGGDLDNDGTAEAWDFLASLYKDGYANPGAQYDLNGQQALFTAGRTGILAINSYVIQSLLTDRSVRFDWSVYEPPPGAAGPSPLPLDYGYLTMAAKAKAQDATWEYIRFLSGRQAVTAYADGFGPTLLTARDDTHVRGTDDPHYQALFKLTARARPYTADPKGVDVLHAACDEFELCVSGKKSGSQAAKDANDKIDQLLAG
jgi:ABC-type glycerol-3-phosphate transport system substrate-binding protein